MQTMPNNLSIGLSLRAAADSLNLQQKIKLDRHGPTNAN